MWAGHLACPGTPSGILYHPDGISLNPFIVNKKEKSAVGIVTGNDCVKKVFGLFSQQVITE
jgi:hypothetical protein